MGSVLQKDEICSKLWYFSHTSLGRGTQGQVYHCISQLSHCCNQISGQTTENRGTFFGLLIAECSIHGIVSLL